MLLNLFTLRGYTFSRSRTGVVLHRFFSRLPSGGPKSNAGSGSYCVLDCIFQEHEQQQRQQHGRYQGQTEQDQQIISLDTDMVGDGVPQDVSCSDEGPAGTYYIQDVLAWRGYSLVDCGAEFRLFWLQSKLAEESEGDWCLNGGAEGPGHQHRWVYCDTALVILLRYFSPPSTCCTTSQTPKTPRRITGLQVGLAVASPAGYRASQKCTQAFAGLALDLCCMSFIWREHIGIIWLQASWMLVAWLHSLIPSLL